MQGNNIAVVNRQQANKKFLLLFFLCCGLPFVAAKLALEFSWFSAGVTNKGQWLDREIQVLPETTHSHQHWHLVYVKSNTCDIHCELALYTLQQIYSSFGRQQSQISTVIVADKPPEKLVNFPSVKWQSSAVTMAELQDHILIVNQLGIAILRYPVVKDLQHMPSIGKDIRTDLRRLMAYDRDGA